MVVHAWSAGCACEGRAGTLGGLGAGACVWVELHALHGGALLLLLHTCVEGGCCWLVVVHTLFIEHTLHVSTAPGAGRVDGDGGGVLLVHVAVRLGSSTVSGTRLVRERRVVCLLCVATGPRALSMPLASCQS
jgi:hypothetical protein